MWLFCSILFLRHNSPVIYLLQYAALLFHSVFEVWSASHLLLYHMRLFCSILCRRYSLPVIYDFIVCGSSSVSEEMSASHLSLYHMPLLFHPVSDVRSASHNGFIVCGSSAPFCFGLGSCKRQMFDIGAKWYIFLVKNLEYCGIPSFIASCTIMQP